MAKKRAKIKTAKRKRRPARRPGVTSETVPILKVHPWRICPPGQHYRRPTTVRPHTRLGRPVRGGPRAATCAQNSSGRDQLYDVEIEKIAEMHFDQFKSTPLGSIQEFKNAEYPQDAFDHLILGWTSYWNSVLNPADPLDPKLVKALIATESRFNPSAWNRKRGPGRARGLTQVTDDTVRLLTDDHNEFTDHFLTLSEDDMLVPNFAICAGVRWLFRKKQLASAKLEREATWIEAVAEYKSYLRVYLKNPNHEQMRRLISMHEELKNAR